MNRRFLVLIILSILFLSTQAINAEEPVIYEMFSINLLSPNTSAARNQWSLHIETNLSRIGIGVTEHESTGWGNIAPRTWSYPYFDYDYIPTYEQGGYDLLVISNSYGLDWNPTGIYDTTSIIPGGDNYCQYSNSVYDSTLQNYLTEFDDLARKGYAKQLQQILYEDLPSISLVYPQAVYGIKENIKNLGLIDPLLFTSGDYRPEYWDDPDDHDIRYAIPYDLRDPNIFTVESYFDNQWMQAVYGSLVQRYPFAYDWDTQIASSISLTEVADNKLDVTVYLDSNAKFSDGETVLPEDVKYSYELYMTEKIGSSAFGFLTSWFDSNDSIEIINNVPGGGLIFHMNHNTFNAYDILSYGIIDKHAPGNTGVFDLFNLHGLSIFNDATGSGDAGFNLVKSCGPFKVTSYSYSLVHMQPNTYYNGYSPSLNDFYMVYVSGASSALADLAVGSVDIIDALYFTDPSDYDGLTGISYEVVQGTTNQKLAINQKHPILGTGELTPVGTPDAAKSIRKAISHLINRTLIVEEILDGLGDPGVSDCPKACAVYDNSLQPYECNITKAIEFMAAAGYNVYEPLPTETPTPTDTVSSVKLGIILVAVVGITSTIKRRRGK